MLRRCLFTLCIVLISTGATQAQLQFSDEWAVGSWFGRALPNDPATSPFPEVVMTPTFLADGNVIANDSHELTNPHVTSHGNWFPIGYNRISATFVWMNLTEDEVVSANGFVGTFKVRLVGEVDPADPDRMTGTVAAMLFPPGTDPLDPEDTGGIPVGVFTIEELGRIKADPLVPTTTGTDLSEELANGSWFGIALPDDPETSPFPEVVMSPTFFADGNVLANDSHELTNPHVTSHGNWHVTGEDEMEATFIWMNLTGDEGIAPNGYVGAFKVRLAGAVNPAFPNQMTGTVAAVLFPPGTDPLDPNDTGGIPVGTFTIQALDRIEAFLPLIPEGPISTPIVDELAIGSWFGNALPDDPQTSPFPEVVMTPTFFADGNVIANDSHELTNPHVTSHGNWVVSGPNQIHATFLWMNLTGDEGIAPNGFVGSFKVRIDGAVDPNFPDQMTGTVAAVLFPPGTDPLDPDDIGGTPVGTFTIQALGRITSAVPPAVVQVGPTLARPGGTASVEVRLSTPLPVAGLQFSIQPVDSDAPGESEPNASGSDYAELIGVINVLQPEGFDVATSTDEAGITNVLMFHPGGDYLSERDAVILEIVYEISSDAPHGHWIDIDIWDPIISDPESEPIAAEAQGGSIHIGLAGDVAGGPTGEGDGNINILDIVKTIRYILGTLQVPEDDFAFFLADPVDDGEINIQDLVWMINTHLNPEVPVKTLSDSPTQPVLVSLDAVQKIDGESLFIPMILEADGTVAALQATMSFNPAQLAVGEPYLVGRAANLTLRYSRSEDGTLGLVIYSITGEVIPPGAGVAIHLPVTILGGASSPMLSLTDVTLVDRRAELIPVILGETSVSIKSSPGAFALTDNAPNPFNPSTTIAYEVPRQAHITLTIHNVLGQEVIRLVNQVRSAGRYTVVWHGKNSLGREVASGIYLYRLTSGTGFSETKRMTLLK